MVLKDKEKLVLALDTSHGHGSVAVVRDRNILGEIVFDASDTHSATLMPAIDYCLKVSKVQISDMDYFAVVIGPGSFTGLRIGLATVKAFCAATGKGVVPLTSLEVLAGAFPFSTRPILTLIDARRGEVYGALYKMDGVRPQPLVGPFSSKPADLSKVLKGYNSSSGFIVCGTGAIRYRETIETALGNSHHFAPERWALPSASILAFLSNQREPIVGADLNNLEPEYIRPPDAKIPEGKLKKV